ncbi:MAG: methyltransferase domain-containing protein [Gemmobacter sp.]|uniref:methyltransferase domain-containing protein n=1 Tax=Gemmobacter sp. TaxID=1898957 RepID=UPI001A5FA56F|nr:methyltransferase domain-containing protein [Gemmobacter sp.]MBL8561551.1 methyltransferase domain-containing protein [Gemmobacter sp.]
MSGNAQDWTPGAYARFRGLRLRPALDLLAQVPELPPGDVVDLGCGDGAVAEALRSRCAGRRVVGVDASPAMLRVAAGYDATQLADIAEWQPETRPALIFSNAALQWLGDHDRLFPRLAGLLAPGGSLAVQMPRQYAAPSHSALRALAAGMFPERFDFTEWKPAVLPAADYWPILAPLGQVSLWESEYLQWLEPAEGAHPVRRFTESTAMRPYLEKLSAAEAESFTAAYDAALEATYPRQPDGSALMPFRRLFLVLTVTG